jgi:hypothetical protein
MDRCIRSAKAARKTCELTLRCSTTCHAHENYISCDTADGRYVTIRVFISKTALRFMPSAYKAAI